MEGVSEWSGAVSVVKQFDCLSRQQAQHMQRAWGQERAWQPGEKKRPVCLGKSKQGIEEQETGQGDHASFLVLL